MTPQQDARPTRRRSERREDETAFLHWEVQMNKLTTGVPMVLAAAIAVACHVEGIVDLQQFVSEGEEAHKITPTYEAEWVGVYEGTGSAELLDVGDSYSELPVCLETWVEAGNLRGAVYIQLGVAPSDALMEISDRDYSWDQDGACAGRGVTMTAWCSTEDVTSKDGLLLFGGAHYSPWGGQPQWALTIERRGDELVGLLEVERLEHPAARSSSNNSTVARFSLYVTKAN
jgi:hypothetical protein